MFRGTLIYLLAAASAAPIPAEDFDGVNQASGVNLTVDEGFGARQSGMGITFATFQRGADAVINAPAAMNDVDDFTFATAHAEKFGAAQFDDFAFLLPFEANSTLGVGISRYGVSGIDLRPEGGNPLQSQPQGVFSIADYLVAGAFARRWGGLDMGFHLDLLYRHLDQDGLGIRGDAMGQYTWNGRYRVSALAKGLIPSSAHWESGYTEYELPDLFIGGAARFPAPYFYGNLEVAWQSEGLFARQGKSTRQLNTADPIERPMDFLAASNAGLEFLFDFGLSLRAGLNEFATKAVTSTAAFGIGYDWRHILAVDYSFTPHPDLLSTHRVSLQLTPAFPKLNGLGYRHRGGPSPAPRAPLGKSISPTLESPESAPAGQVPESLESQPAAPAAPSGGVPATVEPPKPAPAGGEKEILENDEEGQ